LFYLRCVGVYSREEKKVSYLNDPDNGKHEKCNLYVCMYLQSANLKKVNVFGTELRGTILPSFVAITLELIHKLVCLCLNNILSST
jgi:hypothetical protein